MVIPVSRRDATIALDGLGFEGRDADALLLLKFLLPLHCVACSRATLTVRSRTAMASPVAPRCSCCRAPRPCARWIASGPAARLPMALECSPDSSGDVPDVHVDEIEADLLISWPTFSLISFMNFSRSLLISLDRQGRE